MLPYAVTIYEQDIFDNDDENLLGQKYAFVEQIAFEGWIIGVHE
jgi:hypothetical protein